MAEIYFGMPLKSRAVAKDWNRVSMLLDNTLRSIFAQTMPDIEVLIACHDEPVTSFDTHPRLHKLVIEEAGPGSDDNEGQGRDKQIKIRRLIEEVCRRGGGYLVRMDADDLVSCRLAEFIHTTNNRRGYTLQSGYILNLGRRYFQYVDNFARHCGSCAVFYLTPEDLAFVPGGMAESIFLTTHIGYEAMSKRLGRPMDAVPFPAMMYIRHHGENLSVRFRPWFSMTRLRNRLIAILRRFSPRLAIPAGVEAEFSVPASYIEE